MPVELRRGGLHLSGTALWLDAHRRAPLAFVSHAHSDHIARHERVIATRATLRLMSHRLGALPSSLPVPYNRPFELGPLCLELLPAGHILGSAQLRVIRSDGTRVTYTGDLNLEASSTAEAVQVAECDTLVLESTFGHPRYRFPPKAEVLGAIEAFARTTLERGATPVLLGYSLGKSQEVIRALTARGHSVVAHESVCAVAEVYRSLGVEVGEVRRFDGTWLPGEVGVFPPHVWKFARLLRPWPRRTAVLTGWAVDPGTARRYGADEAFPLSDHADFEGLLSYAKATGASEVLTHHGFAEELARALRDRGIEARPLGTVRQLDLFG